MDRSTYKERIGKLIQEIRISRGMTQADLAKELSTSQSAVNRIEKGAQNISLEMVARIGDVLSSEFVSLNSTRRSNFRVGGNVSCQRRIDGFPKAWSHESLHHGVPCAPTCRITAVRC